MKTLGFAVAEWVSEFLPAPDDPSKPFRFTDEQMRFVRRWYSLDDQGRYVYRRACLMQPKGHGKTPVAAALDIAELCGPVCFDGWNAAGEPVGVAWGNGGRPPALVQVAALSESQASSNVYSLVRRYLLANDGRAADRLGVVLGRGGLYLKSDPTAELLPVTSASGSREGQRVTHGTLDESHLWVAQNEGLKIAAAIQRNVSKMDGRVLECANAFETGADSLAERTARAYENGEPGILFVANRPSAEPREDMSNAELRALLVEAYGDAHWVNLDRILLELRDPGNGWEASVRYFLNTPAAGASALVDPERWAELATDEELEPGSRIALGFTGPRDDVAALMACSEGRLYLLAMWTDEDVDRGDISATVEQVFRTYKVSQMYVDKRMWRSEAEQWERTYGKRVLDFPVTPTRMTPVIERFLAAVGQGSVHHEPDEDLDRHFAAARIRTRQGRRMLESPDGRPIDLVIAALLAFEAWSQTPEKKGWRDYVMDLTPEQEQEQEPEEELDGEKSA